MNAARRFACHHSELSDPAGLALLAFGLPAKHQDGIASALCQTLPAAALSDVCRFDLTSYDHSLRQCLSGHRAAIIIDATGHGLAPGTISITDVSAFLEHQQAPEFDSDEGLHLANELRAACLLDKLPARVILFAVGIDDAILAANATERRSMLAIVQRLSLLVSTILRSLKQQACFGAECR